MSLKPKCFDPIPEETVRAARAAFPKGNGYLRMRDEFGPLYVDEAFAELFSTRGQPALSGVGFLQRTPKTGVTRPASVGHGVAHLNSYHPIPLENH